MRYRQLPEHGGRLSKWKIWTAIVGLLALTSAAQAALVGRDINGNPIAGSDPSAVFLYDTVLDITWLRDANVNGPMDWTQANSWAAGLTVGSYSGWRLPTMIANPDTTFAYSGTDYGYNVRTTSGSTVFSEVASLWYDTLGNKAYCDTAGVCPQPGYGLVSKGDFKNLQPSAYWSGLEYAPFPTYAWYFSTNGGSQGYIDKSNSLYALAVRPGDVAPVPAPAAAWLMLSGLGVLGAVSRRRQSRASA